MNVLTVPFAYSASHFLSFPAIVAGAILLLGCDSNEGPQTLGSIPDQTLVAGGKIIAVSVVDNFTDPDGDPLTYRTTSSATGVATASVQGGLVMVTPVTPGTSSIEVTVSDPEGLNASLSFSAIVKPANRPPEVGKSIENQTLTGVEVVANIDASDHFSDPDGDVLTYSAESNAPQVASVSTAGSTVTVTSGSEGQTTVTVTAADPSGLTAGLSFLVTVRPNNRAPVAGPDIPSLTLVVGSSDTVQVAGNFSDPDGDSLTFTATSSTEEVAAVSVLESALAVTAIGAGNTAVTVIATDPWGLSAQLSFLVTVRAASR